MQAKKLDEIADTPPNDIPGAVRKYIISEVYQQSGISLENLTCNFVDTRLRRRLRNLEIKDPASYLDYINTHSDEVFHLVDAFTTNETRFFRTPSLWEYLKENLLTNLVDGNDGRRINFWSAACSTGEEAYSLAILCDTVFSDSGNRRFPSIDATDICQHVLEKARTGCFGGRSIRQLKNSHTDVLEQHFTREASDSYRVNPALNKQVKFFRHNLMKDTGKRDHYDLVLLRNVLIYFAEKDQQTILNNVLRSMKPGSLLAIGESESLAFADIELDFVQPFLYQRPVHG